MLLLRASPFARGGRGDLKTRCAPFAKGNYQPQVYWSLHGFAPTSLRVIPRRNKPATSRARWKQTRESAKDCCLDCFVPRNDAKRVRVRSPVIVVALLFRRIASATECVVSFLPLCVLRRFASLRGGTTKQTRKSDNNIVIVFGLLRTSQ